jgi:ribosomal protein S18 acetylase RimI-like enzyme
MIDLDTASDAAHTLVDEELPMTVQRVQNRDELRTFLRCDRLANAYLLGNLDPAYFQFCRWYGMRNGEDALGSLVLLYTGLSLPVVFMTGNGPNFAELLEGVKKELPRRFHFQVLEDQMDTVRDVFDPPLSQRMIRMGLQRDVWEAMATDVSNGIAVRRLGHRDTASIMKLYEHYPDNFFEPYQLETGYYFGVRDDDVGLASIAGIHVISEDHDVAVIGNFVTHPARRGRGLASACTERLLRELFENVSLVALNVQEGNEPAVKMYEKFGFQQNNVFFEGRTTKD